jgi:hypothetical protein
MATHGPALVAQVEAGAPLVDVLDALGLPRDIAPDLGERAELRAAQARRRAVLRAQLAHVDKGQRDAAIYELETLHGWRRPGSKTAEERFSKVLARFAAAQPDGYRVLYDMLIDAGEVSRG